MAPQHSCNISPVVDTTTAVYRLRWLQPQQQSRSQWHRGGRRAAWPPHTATRSLRSGGVRPGGPLCVCAASAVRPGAAMAGTLRLFAEGSRNDWTKKCASPLFLTLRHQIEFLVCLRFVDGNNHSITVPDMFAVFILKGKQYKATLDDVIVSLSSSMWLGIPHAHGQTV